MAVVARVEAPSVGVDPLPNARVTAELPIGYAAPIAQGFDSIAGVAEKVAQDEQAKATTAQVVNFQTQVMSAENNLNDPTNQDGVFSDKFKGQNFGQLRGTVMPKFQAATDAALKSLSNPNAKEQAQQWLAGRTASFDSHLNDVALAYKGQYEDQTQQGFVAMGSQDAANAYSTGDPKAEDKLGNLVGGMEAYYAAHGHGSVDPKTGHIALDDYGKFAVAKTESNVFRSVVEGAIVKNPMTANAMLAQYGSRMTVDDRLAVDTALHPYIGEANGQQRFKAWMSGTAEPAGSAIQGAAQSAAEVAAMAQGMPDFIAPKEGSAQNPYSTANGPGQFIDSTWLNVVRHYAPDVAAGKSDADLLALKTDPTLSKRMTVAYSAEIGQSLYGSGLPVTPQTLYLGYQFGAEGARAILTASPNEAIGALIGGKTAKINRIDAGQPIGAFLQSRGIAAPTALPPMVLPDGTPDFVGMAKRANELSNPYDRRTMLGIIDHEMSLSNLQREQTDRANMETLNNAVANAGPGVAITDVIPPSLMPWVNAHGKLDEYREALKNRQTGALVQSDPLLVDQIRRSAVTDPQGFLRTNLTDPALSNNISTTDLHELSAMQETLHAGHPAPEWATQEQLLSLAHQELGISGTGNAEQQAKFNAAFYNEQRAWMAQHPGKKPTSDEMQGMINTLKLPFVRERLGGWWTDATAPLYALGADAAKYRIPDASRAMVVTALTKVGIKNPTEAQIASAYARMGGTKLGVPK